MATHHIQRAAALALALLALTAAHASAADVRRLAVVDARAGTDLPAVCCLSGADTGPSGELIIISDRGTLYGAALDTGGGTLTLTTSAPLTLSGGTPLPEWRADAEGVAVDAGGRVRISFEGRHRVALYKGARGVSSSPAPSGLDLPTNGGLEALAVDAGGTLYALPETATDGAFPLLRLSGGVWGAAGALPASEGYVPVGADFDAGGALYVLERKFSFLRFQSRVRRVVPGTGGLSDPETLWQSEPGAYDNLEAVAVIEAVGQPAALLMISDDNAMPFQETQALLFVLN